jgi:hypothetical protein
VRTKWETVDEPAERFHAKCKVFADLFSEGEVGVIIADIDPITNIYDVSARPPSVFKALVAKLMVENLPSYMYKEVIRCIR